jgi:hypothetical protein
LPKEENAVIQTSDLSAGMYVLKLEKKGAIQTKKNTNSALI